MTRSETAVRFLEAFCRNDLDLLASLLTEDFRLQGPFGFFPSRSAYLASLEEDPPEESGFEVLRMVDGGEEVCLFYEYTKPRGTALVAQLFLFREEKIAETLLVLDGSSLV
ncbi:MAG: nuclear transport factor 2 family protein [Candidatus Eisenbacteria bacterium]